MLYYSTSNKEKIQEIQEMFPQIKIIEGNDLPEVQGNQEEVITYKTLLSNQNIIIEDALVIINGKEIVDIKWEIKNLTEEPKQCQWIVNLGIKKKEKIYFYKGILEGIIKKPKIIPENSFPFDPFFVPSNSNKTLHELKLEGKKYLYSRRFNAMKEILNNNPVNIININDIPQWNGKWQNDYTLEMYRKKYNNKISKNIQKKFMINNNIDNSFNM